MKPPRPKRILAAIPDLFFWSKVAGTAQHVGAEAQLATTRQALVDGARTGADLVIVDLEARQIDPLGAILEICSRDPSARPQLVAFAGHARTALLQEARAAGCDQVLTKGALASTLPLLMSHPSSDDTVTPAPSP